MIISLSQVRAYTNKIKKFSILCFTGLVHIVSPTMITVAKIPAQIEKTLESGIASVYGTRGDGFLGKMTASGILLLPGLMVVAHKTLPFGTMVEITNVETGVSTVAKVADRGPYVKGRVVDLSVPVAKALGIKGLGKVKIKEVKK